MPRTLLSYLVYGALFLLCVGFLFYLLIGFLIPTGEEKLYLNPINWWHHTAPPADD